MHFDREAVEQRTLFDLPWSHPSIQFLRRSYLVAVGGSPHRQAAGLAQASAVLKSLGGAIASAALSLGGRTMFDDVSYSAYRQPLRFRRRKLHTIAPRSFGPVECLVGSF
jgi:hypothetical protein